MEEGSGEAREPESEDAPTAHPPEDPAGRRISGTHVIALGLGILLALVGALWRCG